MRTYKEIVTFFGLKKLGKRGKPVGGDQRVSISFNINEMGELGSLENICVLYDGESIPIDGVKSSNFLVGDYMLDFKKFARAIDRRLESRQWLYETRQVL